MVSTTQTGTRMITLTWKFLDDDNGMIDIHDGEIDNNDNHD
jgi:hypothetical protein